jgi:hypothetical protein
VQTRAELHAANHGLQTPESNQPLLSPKSHCAVTLSLSSKPRRARASAAAESTDNAHLLDRGRYHWNDEKRDAFTRSLDENEVQQINIGLDNGSLNVEAAAEKLSSLFERSANASLRPKRRHTQGRRGAHNSWFDDVCRDKRKLYHKAKSVYMKQRSEEQERVLRRSSKEYKKAISKAKAKSKKEFEKKLRQAKDTNPKLYWKLLNSRSAQSKTSGEVSLDDLYEHFKSLNAHPDEDFVDNLTIDENGDELLNRPITLDEIKKAVKILKNGKAPGGDGIINEYMKSSVDLMLPTYHKLFNTILDSGTIPTTWLVGQIIPIYKNKGDPTSPDNYRGITLLSCLGKLFTSIINNRLNAFCESNTILSENQAGFRKSYSTVDHAFVVKSILDIFMFHKKKLYCAYIDYQKAFDSIWRAGLWSKLLNYGIKGKVYRVVNSLYQNVKSCICLNGTRSEYFESVIGVRQGENLSPLLFALYINDMESYLLERGATTLKIGEDDAFFNNMVKLLLLLYADDTVILADTAHGLQVALDALNQYCDKWKLKVNIQKSKVMVFCKRKPHNPPWEFYFNRQKLEVTDEYKYLGVVFNYTGTFNKHRTYVCSQAQKAMFALMRKGRYLDLPIDILLELFDKMIEPILLYGCELWGFESLGALEKLHLKYCKYILCLKPSTPSCMVYGETGRYPLALRVKQRMINYWARLICSDESRLNLLMYRVLYRYHQEGMFTSPWLKCIERIFNECGISNIWQDQMFPNKTWLSNFVKLRTHDQFLQSWLQTINQSPKCYNYRIFKTTLNFEKYLVDLPYKYRRSIIKLRTTNHKLPVERGRYVNVPRHTRYCDLCNANVLGDEFHFILECERLRPLRLKYLPQVYCTRPNVYKFESLLNSEDTPLQLNLGKFIYESMKLVN